MLMGTMLSATGAGGGVSLLPDVPVPLAGVTAAGVLASEGALAGSVTLAG
ncbi:hypothetical protein BCAR13_1760023 [Paraburkholderia caribensis]|nr:hypothetical protein BCAR13_1760023 [Paraburkholderia caribensis]